MVTSAACLAADIASNPYGALARNDNLDITQYVNIQMHLAIC
jgi:hypothetical protein